MKHRLVRAFGAAIHPPPRRLPSQAPAEQLVNALIFVAHTRNIPSLRALYRLEGDRLRVFGGETFTRFSDVRELMARELEKIDWFSGPIEDRADYLTKSYVPFLLAGPNHALRREHIVARVARAHGRLDDLEALLDQEGDVERALARFLFRHLVNVELEPEEVGWLIEYRELGQRLLLLPKRLRTTLLRSSHRKLQARRLHFLKRIEAAGEPIADSWFDAVWFNAGTLGFYPKKALETLRARPDLQPLIRAEIASLPAQRPKTRALIHEMLRVHGRIASTNYVEQGRVRIALLATAVIDPDRYDDPLKVDLSRDHSDTLAFSGPAPTRRCPAERFAPDVMATVVAHQVRSGWLEQGRRRALLPERTRARLGAGRSLPSTHPTAAREQVR